MDEIEVPSYFLCPISLEIMKDPITIPTGITYDRESIERWLFSSSSGGRTCPVTKQPVPPDCELTPNHTLRRLIQSWCVINASRGVQRIPTPKAPVGRAQVAKLIQEASKSPQKKLDSLRRLKSIASHSNANKRCLEAAGTIEFLASIIREAASSNNGAVAPLTDEALSIIYNLHISDAKLRNLVDIEFARALTRVMQTVTFDSRAYAVMLLNKMLEASEPAKITGQVSTNQLLFAEVVQVLRDRISPGATKAALKLLAHLSPLSRNRITVVEAGAVPVLVEILLEHSNSSNGIRICEMALVVMDILCKSADGRAELLGHPAGIAVVSKKILRVSQVATEMAVRILLSVSRFAGTPRVLEEMLQVRAVTKLCLVLQVECSGKAKEKAAEMLRTNARSWRNSPCVPWSLLSSHQS